MYQLVGEYDKALTCWEKSLEIGEGIGTKSTVAASYHNLGTRFLSLGRYPKANEYYQKARFIYADIKKRERLASVWLSQGCVEQAVGNLIKAKKMF